MTDLEKLQEAVLAFRDARDWEQFHTLKDLAAGLAIEAAEFQELLLWKTNAEIERFSQNEGREPLGEELADCMIFILYLANTLDLDISETVMSKLRKNALKYPAEKVKGRADKYTAYETATKD